MSVQHLKSLNTTLFSVYKNVQNMNFISLGNVNIWAPFVLACFLIYIVDTKF